MSAAQQLTPLPVGATIPTGSLRAELDRRRAAGERFSPREALRLLVPLCTELAAVHAKGRTVFVHPSSLTFDGTSLHLSEENAHAAPTLPRDRACLAPEERKGSEGDARASVFTIGALLYELVTGAAVGPGMRRPSELVPGLPASLETILGKALVADPKHRPSDLGALAQALHNAMPGASIAPPPADESHLDGDSDFEVDVKLSMIPPAPAMPSGLGGPAVAKRDPFAVVSRVPQVDDPTQRLAVMKAALEADPRPRYLVTKGGMDHGPFSAVELLQQVASHTFLGSDVLKDTFTSEERAIQDWEEFAPFAEQAKLNRDIKEERKALEAVVVAEKRGAQTKVVFGLIGVGVLLAAIAGLWFRYRNKQATENVRVGKVDDAVAVEIQGGIAGKQGPKGPGGGGAKGPSAPPAGGFPVIGGGMSCEAARDKYVEDWTIGGGTGAPDLSDSGAGAVLNNGTYLNSCGVPSSVAVNICVAIQNGRAVGVTVVTDPKSGGYSSCIASAVRNMSFPGSPRLSVARTAFAAQ